MILETGSFCLSLQAADRRAEIMDTSLASHLFELLPPSANNSALGLERLSFELIFNLRAKLNDKAHIHNVRLDGILQCSSNSLALLVARLTTSSR